MCWVLKFALLFARQKVGKVFLEERITLERKGHPKTNVDSVGKPRDILPISQHSTEKTRGGFLLVQSMSLQAVSHTGHGRWSISAADGQWEDVLLQSGLEQASYMIIVGRSTPL